MFRPITDSPPVTPSGSSESLDDRKGQVPSDQPLRSPLQPGKLKKQQLLFQADHALKGLQARMDAIKELQERVRASDGKDARAEALLEVALRPASARSAGRGSPPGPRRESASNVGERRLGGHVSLPGTPSRDASPLGEDSEDDELPRSRRGSWGSDFGAASRPESKVDGSFMDALDSMPVTRIVINGISYTVEGQGNDEGFLTVRADKEPLDVPRGMLRVKVPAGDAGTPLYRISERAWRELTGDE